MSTPATTSHQTALAFAAPHDKLFINGAWTAPSDEAGRLEVFRPSTGKKLATVVESSAADVDRAVRAAREAFDAEEGKRWPQLPAAERAAALRRVADLVDAEAARLAQIETADCGKPLKEALWDIADVAGCLRYFADQAEALEKSENADLALPDERFQGRLQHQPMGVVGAIIPWNYPLLMLAWKVAPALAAGCTVVLKPSELTPLTALEFCDLCRRAALPAGVLNVVTVADADAAVNAARADGYYVQPTIVVCDRAGRNPNDFTVWREEIFGPVLAVATFGTEDDAVRMANDSAFGLAGAVLSKCNDRTARVARRLRAGIVWRNCSQPCFVQGPWGGIGRSGIGRELGPRGIYNYLEPKQVVEYTTTAAWGWYTLPSRI